MTQGGVTATRRAHNPKPGVRFSPLQSRVYMHDLDLAEYVDKGSCSVRERRSYEFEAPRRCRSERMTFMKAELDEIRRERTVYVDDDGNAFCVLGDEP